MKADPFDHLCFLVLCESLFQYLFVAPRADELPAVRHVRLVRLHELHLEARNARRYDTYACAHLTRTYDTHTLNRKGRCRERAKGRGDQRLVGLL